MTITKTTKVVNEEAVAAQEAFDAKYLADHQDETGNWMRDSRAREIRATFLVKIGSEAHWVVCYSYDNGDRFDTFGNVAVARVGRTGSKLWPSKVHVWKQKDGSYRASMSTVHLNRQAVIVGWNVEEYGRYLSNHNSANR